MRAITVLILMLMLAPHADAQLIDCGPGGADCTDTLYGLGNDDVPVGPGPFTNTHAQFRPGPGDGSCGPDLGSVLQGQILLRDQNSCVVSATSRCAVEIPQIVDTSGFFNTGKNASDFGPLGIVATSNGGFADFGGNLGFRQLAGTCTQDSGEACGVDGDCPSGAGCLSTCASDAGTTCSTESDAACPVANDCRTRVSWEGIGLCTDNTTVCNTDAECTGEDICLSGFVFDDSGGNCNCCQSSTGVTCALFGFVEYPALNCGQSGVPTRTAEGPGWIFEGGRGTKFEHERIQVAGQQEGVCAGNRFRPCGALGDFWAGGANGKCTGAPTCGADPFDEDNLALISDCDDVAFGGLAGDVCDFSENAFRLNPVNPDGTQNTSECILSAIRLVGTPGELCALPNDIPDGDPQPGCRLTNVGIVPQPDLDCNGIDDTDEGRCQPEGGAICSDPDLCPPCAVDGDCASGNCINNGDLCQFIGEVNWFLDTNNDDIGDECQCGDGNGDGAITGLDIAAVAVCANDPLSNAICDATIIDATGDNATTAEDIGGIVAAVTGAILPSDLQCLRNIDTTQ